MSDSDDDDDIAYMALVALLSDELEAPNRPRLSLACLPAFPKLESDWARIYRHGDSRSFVKPMMIDRPGRLTSSSCHSASSLRLTARTASVCVASGFALQPGWAAGR